jgi:hypothetical protein
MVDDPSSVHVRQGFERHPVTLLLLIDPRREGLSHDLFPPNLNFGMN